VIHLFLEFNLLPLNTRYVNRNTRDEIAEALDNSLILIVQLQKQNEKLKREIIESDEKFQKLEEKYNRGDKIVTNFRNLMKRFDKIDCNE